MNRVVGDGRFLRLIGSGIVVQALISAASFTVSLILIRQLSAAQYGYYVLVTGALFLVMGIQAAYIQAPTVHRLTQYDQAGRSRFIGLLLVELRRLCPLAAGLASLIVSGLWAFDIVTTTTTLLVLAGIVAAVPVLFREFFRMVLLAYRRPVDVLRADAVYVALLISGAFAASLTPWPATISVATLGLAALFGGALLATATWRREPWATDSSDKVLHEFAATGSWAVAGSMVHWSFYQGYNFLVAALLDVQAVAALAATRLLLMPVTLMSFGALQIMLPTAALWMREHGAKTTMRRLALVALGFSAIALCYCVVLWLLRDWIFTELFKKDFAQRDELLGLWCGVFLVSVWRDHLSQMLVARNRFKELTTLAFGAATLSLAVSSLMIFKYGVTGGLVGALAGELLNLAGIVVLSIRESRR